MILTVFLPGLVFESGYRLDVGQLRRTSGAIAFLAVPGVIITAAVVAIVLSFAAGLPPELGFIVGAMLAATDPAAVIATIKRMHAPERLARSSRRRVSSTTARRSSFSPSRLRR